LESIIGRESGNGLSLQHSFSITGRETGKEDKFNWSILYSTKEWYHNRIINWRGRRSY
jgi:hypothetical protein